ncbi:MAG TPA: methyl-accepting chemotaxis protein [Candidatus Limnocylindria bacterium]|jgi:hypothetical protein|nr:methyl-accepting chemotaxis protein [Candidatus Limnocylindria bacterium]
MARPNTTSLRKSFRNIRVIIVLLLGFVTVQGVVLWRVCHEGKVAISSLESEGLPSLQNVAGVQQHLALYRLNSFEALFAQDADKPAKLRLAEQERTQALDHIGQLRKILEHSHTEAEVDAVETAFQGLVTAFGQVRALVDTDFQKAMASLDKDIPAKVAALNAATEKLSATCYGVSGDRARNVVSSFTHIENSVFSLSPASVFAAALTTLLVTVLARRTRLTMGDIVDRLSGGSEDVTEAAQRMSETSRKLAESGSSQAASVEETSASIEEIRSMVQRNSENATSAKGLANEARSAAEGGAREMAELSRAMDEIKASSDTIATILKSIDEIAFQTNILALNAAIEAARAGDAGLGFAVVADEVRNLAHRAGSAARETAQSIDESLRRNARGVEISKRVSTGLQQIVDKARQVDDLVAQIALASSEQSRGISQVNAAMTQIDRDSQAIAAEADHSAASSGKLSQQALDLRAAVATLITFVDEVRRHTEEPPDATETADSALPHGAAAQPRTNGTAKPLVASEALLPDQPARPSRQTSPSTNGETRNGKPGDSGFHDHDAGW